MNQADELSGNDGSAAWPALREALDARAQPRVFFVRDDDAGWADDRLLALLDTMRDAQAPIDLAVIPEALSPALAATLCARFDAAGGRIGVHQHGHTHANHETEGRKSEFGAARDLAQRARDLNAGRDRLQRAFGARLDAIFTPPWNRCAGDLPPLLATLGYAALSRDAGAPVQLSLPELPVHVDWCRHWREAQGHPARAAAAIDAALARAVHAHERAVGLMLHHAAMSDDELALLRTLAHRLVHHPRAVCLPMRDCLAQPLAAAA